MKVITEDENGNARELYRKIETKESLKPCPFCGAPAELWEFEPTPDYFQKVVMCSNSGDEEENQEGCPMDMPPSGFYCETKRSAISIWNARDGECSDKH